MTETEPAREDRHQTGLRAQTKDPSAPSDQWLPLERRLCALEQPPSQTLHFNGVRPGAPITPPGGARVQLVRLSLVNYKKYGNKR